MPRGVRVRGAADTVERQGRIGKSVNGIALGEGHGEKIGNESHLKFVAAEDSEVLLFDLL
jgi:hypothetical protein